jgi:glyoxylase-like metal-dependent hydrolase (beta-lactamase superfamily II)
MLEVIQGVYRIPNSFVNLYLIDEPDGATLIDAGLKSSGAKLVLEALSKLGKHPRDLKRVLITHSDGDHVGSLSELRQATGASIGISALDGAMLERGLPGRPGKGWLGALAGAITARIAPIMPLKADVWLEDGTELPVLGGLRVVATSGHTPGHLAFFAPRDGVLFAGDALMAMGGRLSWRDGPFTGDYARGWESVRRLEALRPSVVCCGHGNPLKGSALEFPKN